MSSSNTFSAMKSGAAYQAFGVGLAQEAENQVADDHLFGPTGQLNLSNLLRLSISRIVRRSRTMGCGLV
jgi:hypothetical protein